MLFRLILSWCLMSSFVAFSAPVIKRDNLTYEVNGLTVQEVRKQIDQLGPMHPTEKKRYDGITLWDLKWKYQISRRGKIWIVTSRSVRLNIKVSVPKWVNRDEASPLAQRQWKIYQSNLVRHEQGHVNIAISAANAVDKYIGAYSSASSLEQMRVSIERNTKPILDRFRKYDLNYDKRTRHGANQGARFPNNLAK